MFFAIASRLVVGTLIVAWLSYGIFLVLGSSDQAKRYDPAVIETIDIKAYFASHGQPGNLLIDTRSEASFRIRHAEGANHCDLNDLRNGTEKALALFRLADRKNVYLYCSSNTCGTSSNVAQYMRYWPVNRLTVVRGEVGDLLDVIGQSEPN
jgi:rhodanese-related sulfurtransferase